MGAGNIPSRSRGAAMSVIELSRFCLKTELNLRAPFSRAGYTWAMDRHILLRVPLRADVPEIDGAPHAERIYTDSVGQFCPVSPFELPDPGTVECDACYGRGTKHDCPDCSCRCDPCGATGKMKALRKYVSIGKSLLGLGYVALIMTLPGLEVEIPSPGADRMHFRFDGGDGILMLIRAGSKGDIVADLLKGVLS
jgi:hypothetical protein